MKTATNANMRKNAQYIKDGKNNSANTKGGEDGQTWGILKKIETDCTMDPATNLVFRLHTMATDCTWKKSSFSGIRSRAYNASGPGMIVWWWIFFFPIYVNVQLLNGPFQHLDCEQSLIFLLDSLTALAGLMREGIFLASKTKVKQILTR